MSENTAKQRLITSLENCIEEKSKSGGVIDQGDVIQSATWSNHV